MDTEASLSGGEIYGTVAVIFALILISAFFSGSETALTAVSRGWLHQKENEGSRRAAIVNALRRRKDRLIGAILLGNTVVNILSSALATSLLTEMFGATGVAYATLLMTFLLLIFAEVLPKTYAITHTERAALAVALPMRAVIFVLGPLTSGITHITALILRLFGAGADAKPLGPNIDALRGLIELHKPVSEMSQDEKEELRQERMMLRSVLDLARTDVDEVMIHRSKMEMIDADQPPEEIVDQVLNTAYTRIPLYRDTPDNIVGIIHAKALLREVRREGAELSRLDIMNIASPPWFIPDSTTLLDQLQEFRKRQEHVALVVDEYGTLLGLITLEDILEEIVGNIEDEQDAPVRGVIPQNDGSYLVNGTVTIRDLNRDYEWGLPSDDYSTIAGLVLYEARRIPRVGESYTFFGFRFEIMRRQRNQITLIKVAPPARRRRPGEEAEKAAE
jgi:Mg2+/Co2+ transporter CorB